MIQHTTFAALALIALIASPGHAIAQVPLSVSFQGVLTDDQGTPLDGSFNLTFRLWNAPTGGGAVWTETQNGVAVMNGHFAVELGAVNPVNPIMNQPYYLGISVNGAPELAPRTPLRSSPYALGLLMPFRAIENTSSSTFSIRNTGSGAAIEAVGRLKVGSVQASGTGEVWMAGVSTPVVELGNAGPAGGSVQVLDEADQMVGVLKADLDGSGGEFEVRRGPGQVGFHVDGNWASTGEPLLKLQGSSRSVTLNMWSTGDGSVQVPDEAIGAREILDEPGIASRWEGQLATITVPAGQTRTLLSRTLTAPGPGYVLAIAGVWHTGLEVSVSDQSGVPGAVEGGGGFHQGVFPVTAAGNKTFYVIGRNSWGSGGPEDYAFGRTLTLMYFPTARGNIDLMSPGAQPQPGP